MKLLTFFLFFCVIAKTYSQTSEKTQYEYNYDKKTGIFTKVEIKTVTTKTIVEQHIPVPSSILTMDGGIAQAIETMNGKRDSVVVGTTLNWSYNPVKKSFWQPTVFATSYKYKGIWSEPTRSSVPLTMIYFYKAFIFGLIVLLFGGAYFHLVADDVWGTLLTMALFGTMGAFISMLFIEIPFSFDTKAFLWHSLVMVVPLATVVGLVGVKMGEWFEELHWKAQWAEYEKEEITST